MGRGLPQARPTRDIDFLGLMPNDVDTVSRTIRAIGETVFQDGMVYDFSRMTNEILTPESDYRGVRLKFSGWLGKARVPMQIDIGFGDKVVPEPTEMVFPPFWTLSHRSSSATRRKRSLQRNSRQPWILLT